MSDIELTVLLIWLGVLGGTIGSFLNVVVYRLPAGMSLAQPGSHCPACGHPIRWYDNIPVVGWLSLRGRCRDCDARISLRYPLVEATTALMFLSLGAVTLLSGGANLPLRPMTADGETIFLAWTGVRLAAVLAFHLLLLTTLLPMALIEYDGKPLPWRLSWPLLVVGIGAPIFWPYLHPVPARLMGAGWPSGLIDGIAGLGVGVVVGLGVERLVRGRGVPGLAAGPACVGLVLGWQAAILVVMAALVVYVVVQGLGSVLPGLRRLPLSGWLLLGSFGWVLAWQPMMASLPFFGH